MNDATIRCTGYGGFGVPLSAITIVHGAIGVYAKGPSDEVRVWLSGASEHHPTFVLETPDYTVFDAWYRLWATRTTMIPTG